MANKIQIRRSSANAAPAAGSLQKGELAWVDHGTGGGAGCLYIGDMTANGAIVRTIGGTGSSSFVTDILNNTALTGTPTAPTVGADDDSTAVATTEYVDRQVLAATNPISQASDTDISGSQSGGAMLVWDGVDSWDDVAMSGDVSMAANGATTVNSVAANSVNLGTDTVGNYISTITGTANEIEVSANGVESAAVTIGLPNDVTISGNLTVQGTTTQVDSTVVTVADPIFTLGADAADSKDRGIVMKYNDGSSRLAWMGMDDTDNKFKYISQATNTSEVLSGSLGDAAFGNIDGTLTTASQTAITEIGTITAGTWNADIVTSAYGGLGIDTSSETGIAKVDGGTWEILDEMPVALGGTGLQSVATNSILVGAGTADMTVLAAGSAGQKLMIGSGGAPEWSDTMDGGTF